MKQMIIALSLLVMSAPALADRPNDKILVCHVGNELGSNGESYQDNPDCDILPPYDGHPDEYICPDAGKIDLILVSKNSKHGENHFFAGASDYAPVLEGAGDDPADFEDSFGDGIDDGCLYALCPCAVDDGEAGVMWRAATEAMRPTPEYNDCNTTSYAPYPYREAASLLPNGLDYYGMFVDAEPGIYGEFSVCGTFSGDSYFVLPTTELQHNACVRLIDLEFGEATDPSNGEACTVQIR